MLSSIIKKQLTVIIIAAFLFQIIGPASNAEAKWQDNSDQLPGTVSTTTLVLIGVGTLAVMGIIFYATKSSKKAKEKEIQKQREEKDKEKQDEESSGFYDNGLNNRVFSNARQNSFDTNKKVSLMPFVGLKSTSALEPTFKKENFNFSNQAVVFGLAVNF